MKICPLPKSFPTQVGKSIFQTIQNALTFCTMSFSYVTLHIWTHLAEWGTNANDENMDKTAFTFSARKKKDSVFLKIFFENEFLKDMEIYQKKTN